jgi:glycine oxidase
MSESTEVIVLGAGVAGCATAYFLARDGVKVTVIEREAIGSFASGFALGLLNPLTGSGIPGPVQPMAEKAFKMHLDLWPTLQDESGVDFQAKTMPHLELCLTDDDITAEREELKLWEKADGFSAQWLKSEEVHRLESRFSQDVKGGILLEEVGMLDSYRYTLALAQAAEHYGAEIMHGEAVGLKSIGNRITGVRLKSGAIACDAVVVALGPWSGQVSSWLGLDIPVQPLKGQILYLEAPDPPLKYHVHGPCSFVHKADNLVWVGATEERADFDTHTTVEARDYLIHRALKMMPYLGQLRLVQQTACLRPVTPDSRPIIGKAPGWDGVYLATGAAKKGILLSPGIGRSTADLITKGETSLPIEPFAPERFTSPD